MIRQIGPAKEARYRASFKEQLGARDSQSFKVLAIQRDFEAQKSPDSKLDVRSDLAHEPFVTAGDC